MARGRFISKGISTSETLADLSNDTARMVWAWMIPHLDVEGRITGKPRVWKAQVMPLFQHTFEDIQAAFDELHGAGLITLYDDAEGNRVVQFANFETHQQGMRRDREAASKFGPVPSTGGNSRPSPDLVPTGSATTPTDAATSRTESAQLQVEDQDQVKGESRAREAPHTPPGESPDARAVAIAEELAKHDVSRDIAADLLGWATTAIGPILADKSATAERCVAAIKLRLGQLAPEEPVHIRRRALSNSIGYLPERLRKEREEARAKNPPRPKPEPIDRITDEERAANAAAAREHGPKLRAALGKIGGAA
jgi:hypothetical protein